MKPQPLSQRDLRPGDRLVLIALDNSRYVVEVTNAANGSTRGRRVGPGGPEDKTETIYSASILCREGQPEVRWAGNLVPGDLVYTPNYRSGLQYAKVVLIADRCVGLLRWNEAKRDWLKRPQSDFGDVEWIAHESEPGAVEAFFNRTEQDRARWQASPGRSRSKLDRATGEHRWVEKRRRWAPPQAGKAAPARPEITREDVDRLSQIEAVDEDNGQRVAIATYPSSPRAVEGRLITFVYEGNLGRQTKRTVLCWRSTAGGTVRGFCLLRQAIRTFRADRMFDTRDARTGESLDADGFFRSGADGGGAARQLRTRAETPLETKPARRETATSLPLTETSPQATQTHVGPAKKQGLWAAVLALLGFSSAASS